MLNAKSSLAAILSLQVLVLLCTFATKNINHFTINNYEKDFDGRSCLNLLDNDKCCFYFLW